MQLPTVLSFVAAYLSLIMGVAVLFRDRHSLYHRLFAAGMFLCAIEEMLRAFSYDASLPLAEVRNWQEWILLASALIPGVWFVFSISYARANSTCVSIQLEMGRSALCVIPVPFFALFRSSLFAPPPGNGKKNTSIRMVRDVLEYYILIISVIIVFNIERIIRSSIGRTRWQLKFMALGIGGLFALRIYTGSQSILYKTLDTSYGTTSAMALLAAICSSHFHLRGDVRLTSMCIFPVPRYRTL